MALPALMFVILAATLFAFIFFATSNMWEVLFLCAAAAIIYGTVTK